MGEYGVKITVAVTAPDPHSAVLAVTKLVESQPDYMDGVEIHYVTDSSFTLL